MPKLTIDQREVEVPPGATILDAARKLGIDIPALCFLEGCEPSTSCLCCLVKLDGNGAACAFVRDSCRRRGRRSKAKRPKSMPPGAILGIAVSDHLGDCVAPCYLAVPREMDIPQMLRQISSGDMRGAIATIKARHRLARRFGPNLSGPLRKNLPPPRFRRRCGHLPVETLRGRRRSGLGRSVSAALPAGLGKKGGHHRCRTDRAGRRLLSGPVRPCLHCFR